MIREWRDEVRLGMIRLLSRLSRVTGRSPVFGRVKDEGAASEGAMIAAVCSSLELRQARFEVEEASDASAEDGTGLVQVQRPDRRERGLDKESVTRSGALGDR